VTIDPFAALGLPARFELDPAALDRAWRARAREVHPDRLAAGAPPGSDARRRAEEASARLNDARRRLADWPERAHLLLGTTAADLPRLADAAFLAAQLDAREALDAARAAGDGVAVARWAGEARAALGALEAEVAALFGMGGAPNRAAVLDRLARARFHQALLADASRAAPPG
jgi:molecular chaperone HscB